MYNNAMTGISQYISTISVNVNVLNFSIKRHRREEERKHNCIHYRKECLITENIREWKRIFHAIEIQIKAGVTILILDKVDF